MEELKKIENTNDFVKKAIDQGIVYIRANSIQEANIFFDAAQDKMKKKSRGGEQAVRLSILDKTISCCKNSSPVRNYILNLLEEIAKADKKKVLGNDLKPNIETLNRATSDPIQLANLYATVELYSSDQEYLQFLKNNNGGSLARSQLESEKQAIAANLSKAERARLNLTSTVELSQKQIANLESASDSMNTVITLKDQQLREIKYQRQIDSVVQMYSELQISQKEELITLKDASNTRMLYAIIGTVLALILLAFSFYKSVLFNRQLHLEKAKSDELLLNILPANIAREIKENGKVNTREYENSTVLFSDFLGFSQIAKKVSASELVADLNTCFTAFDKLAKKYNVEKIKTIGDAYMCIGGIPEPSENSAENVINMGIEMQGFLEKWNEERELMGKPPLQARIGVHTGKVAAGVVGFNKFCYDVWGDTVNVASRIESNGIVNKVNVSESTKNLLRKEYKFHSRGEVEIKNMGSIKMYYII
jgi:class 3 adenylate cyclase